MVLLSKVLHAGKPTRKKFLSLEEFLFRQQVLSTYRSLMRAIYKHHEKVDLANFAKQEFTIDSAGMELSQRKYMLSEGIRRINMMATPMGWTIKL